MIYKSFGVTVHDFKHYKAVMLLALGAKELTFVLKKGDEDCRIAVEANNSSALTQFFR